MTQPKHRYLIEVFWSDEDGGYIAIAPDLPDCSAYGDTPTDAIQEMEDVQWRHGCKPGPLWVDRCQTPKLYHSRRLELKQLNPRISPVGRNKAGRPFPASPAEVIESDDKHSQENRCR